MLAEIYTWFTEGFDTADLKDAKAARRVELAESTAMLCAKCNYNNPGDALFGMKCATKVENRCPSCTPYMEWLDQLIDETRAFKIV
jgi:hypothetical protein